MRTVQTPYFLWDYELTDSKIRKIIKGSNEVEKIWLVSRILTHARFEDVFKYLTINDIVNIFPKLSLPSNIKDAWKRALSVWGYHV